MGENNFIDIFPVSLWYVQMNPFYRSLGYNEELVLKLSEMLHWGWVKYVSVTPGVF